MVTDFPTLSELLKAIRAGKVPTNAVSPGFAAATLGISRQAIHNRIERGRLRAWRAEGYVLVDVDDIHRHKA